MMPTSQGGADEAWVRDLLDHPDGARALFARDQLLTSLASVVSPAPRSASERARLLDAVATTSRFARFRASVAVLLGIADDFAGRLLDGIDRVASWEASPWPGISLFHLEAPLAGAPIAAQAVVGFVRVPAGVSFPRHGHVGAEDVLIVQGRVRDSDGSVAGLGDVVHKAAGTEHELTALAGPDLIYLAVVREGVQFGDVVMRPGHSDL